MDALCNHYDNGNHIGYIDRLLTYESANLYAYKYHANLFGCVKCLQTVKVSLKSITFFRV